MGKTYDVRVGDVVARVRIESESEAVVSTSQRSASERRANVTRIRPGIFMLSWQDAAGLAVVHVADVARGSAYAVVLGRDGTLRHDTGTVERSG